MESKTKTKLTTDQIIQMTKRAFGDNILPETINELTDGYFNTAYSLILSNGCKTVLKAAPSKEVRVMRYEHNMMAAEVFAINQVHTHGRIPVPKVLYYDQKQDIVDCDYFFMEYLQGTPLNKLRSELSEGQFNDILQRIGSYANEMKKITSDHFGHLTQTDKQFTSWIQAFGFMIKELFEDASDMNVKLPCSYQEVADIINENREALDEIHTASFVHKDLWEGNIFVDPKTFSITGFVDFERAIMGDPLMEAVCSFLLDNEGFMKNYYGTAALTREERIRIVLYKIYIFLIMIIECPFRQYLNENVAKWPLEQLSAALCEIRTLK